MTADEWVGKTLGNCVLRSLIGKGGMGLVFSGEHRYLKDKVAVKILHGNYVTNESVARRFFQEAMSTRAIDHPHIIKIFDFGKHEPDGDLYLVMELLEGETLARILKGGQRLDELVAARIGAEIADGLSAAHQKGVIHRDLKPDNIFVDQKTGHIKVIDFGVAKLQGSASSTRAGAVLGTPEFMAPEQAKTASKVGPPTDIYALGVILFRACTGRLPFQAEEMLEMITAHIFEPPPKPSSIVPISSEMEALILHCMEKDPANRPASMAEVRDRLIARSAQAQWNDEASERTHEVRGIKQDRETADSLVPLSSEDNEVDEQTTQTPPPLTPDELMDSPRSTGGATRSERRVKANGPTSKPGTPTTSAGEVVSLLGAPKPLSRPLLAAGAVALVLAASATGILVARRTAKPSVPAVATALVPATTPQKIAPAPEPDTAPSKVVAPSAPLSRVALASVPPSAQVRVGGELRGTTPVELELELPAEVEVSLPGYRTVKQKFTQAGPAEVRLMPLVRPASARPTAKPARPTFLAPGFLKQGDDAPKKPREGLD